MNDVIFSLIHLLWLFVHSPNRPSGGKALVGVTAGARGGTGGAVEAGEARGAVGGGPVAERGGGGTRACAERLPRDKRGRRSLVDSICFSDGEPGQRLLDQLQKNTQSRNSPKVV